MSDRHECGEMIPFFVSGSIGAADREPLEKHLAVCPDCRREVEWWRAVAGEIKSASSALTIAAPPAGPLERAVAQIGKERPFHRRSRPNLFRLAFDLVLGQAAQLRGEVWISTAAVFGLCLAASLVNGASQAVRILGPLAAAAGLAVIGNPRNDPAFELIRSAPMSTGAILLARATLVFGYNLALAAAASLILGAALPIDSFPGLMGEILGSMTFLSALALVLSLWIGTANALAAVCAAWFLRLLPSRLIQSVAEAVDWPSLGGLIEAYRSLWEKPAVLFAIAAVLVLAAKRQADALGGRRLLRRTP